MTELTAEQRAVAIVSNPSVYKPAQAIALIAAAITAAMIEQMERDCSFICEMCASPDTAEPNVTLGKAEQRGTTWWHSRTSSVRHGLFPDRCKASRLRSAWAEREATEGQAKT